MNPNPIELQTHCDKGDSFMCNRCLPPAVAQKTLTQKTLSSVVSCCITVHHSDAVRPANALLLSIICTHLQVADGL